MNCLFPFAPEKLGSFESHCRHFLVFETGFFSIRLAAKQYITYQSFITIISDMKSVSNVMLLHLNISLVSEKIFIALQNHKNVVCVSLKMAFSNFISERFIFGHWIEIKVHLTRNPYIRHLAEKQNRNGYFCSSYWHPLQRRNRNVTHPNKTWARCTVLSVNSVWGRLKDVPGTVR